MTELAWLVPIIVVAVVTTWWMCSGLSRLEQARAREAERREAYRQCMTKEQEREAAAFAAEVLAHEEAAMADLVEWYRKTEGMEDA